MNTLFIVVPVVQECKVFHCINIGSGGLFKLIKIDIVKFPTADFRPPPPFHANLFIPNKIIHRNPPYLSVYGWYWFRDGCKITCDINSNHCFLRRFIQNIY